MAKLLEVVRTGNSDTQETALGAIASAANAAGPSFQPYVAVVFPVLRQYMEVRLPVGCLLVLVILTASWTETMCTACSVCHASFLSRSFTYFHSCQKLLSRVLGFVSWLASVLFSQQLDELRLNPKPPSLSA